MTRRMTTKLTQEGLLFLKKRVNFSKLVVEPPCMLGNVGTCLGPDGCQLGLNGREDLLLLLLALGQASIQVGLVGGHFFIELLVLEAQCHHRAIFSDPISH